MIIYLYLKTHNVTGLKYLGKTIQDPYLYQGSGKHWKCHIKKHGYDVTTEILFSTNNKDEFKAYAKHISKTLNVVESSEFANLCNEQGDGGYTSYTDERNKVISKKLKGRKNYWTKDGTNAGKIVAVDLETAQTVSVTSKDFLNEKKYVGIGVKNKGKTYKKRKEYTRKNTTSSCPHCNKSGSTPNMKRYHFNNCKQQTL